MAKPLNSKANSTKNVNRSLRNKFLVTLSVLFALFVVFMIYIFQGIPSLAELTNPRPPLSTRVYDVNKELIGQFFIENRIEISADSLPRHVIDALIATEDRKFYEHWGVDVDRIFKAMFKTVFLFDREGASTITQQLARNLYGLIKKDESGIDVYIRKIREWITAVQIEKNFTKKEIIELYLNVSFFGKTAYGIETASQIYFGKSATEITVPEAAVFISMLKSPVYYNPDKYPDNALQRRNLVMRNMVEMGKLSESQYQMYKSQPIVLAPRHILNRKGEAPHFLEYVRQQLEELIDTKNYDVNLYKDGLVVYTTLDLRMQRIANKAVKEHLAEYQVQFDKNWSWERNKTLLSQLIESAIKNDPTYRAAPTAGEKDQIAKRLRSKVAFVDSVKRSATRIETGFVVLDPKSGEIRALVGSSNLDFEYGLNHVTQIIRQPGSSFKPFVYITALENGASPEMAVSNEKFNHNGWSPDNSDGSSGGMLTLRAALRNSVNIVTGRLVVDKMAPASQVIETARRLGIKSEMKPYPAIALGVFELSPLEITTAYAALANKGVYQTPISILRIEDRNGVLVDEFMSQSREAIKENTALQITSMLEEVVNSGTGAGLRRYFQRDAAGKTGTTQDFGDAWFVGYTPQLAGGVWVGFDDLRVKFTGWYGQGAKAALPIWGKFMQETYSSLNLPNEYFDSPVDSVSSNNVILCLDSVEKGTPALAGPNCTRRTMGDGSAAHLKVCPIHGGGVTAPKTETQSDGGTEW